MLLGRDKKLEKLRTKDSSYRDAHYKFAFVDVPQSVFGNSSAKVIDVLLAGQGEEFFPGLWHLRHHNVKVDPEEFGVDLRQTEDDAVECVVTMPPIYGDTLNAYYIGIHVPEDVVDSILDADGDPENLKQVKTDGVRLIYLENSTLGMIFIGEVRQLFSHSNLGVGPEPSLENMWLVMNHVCGE
jgi:hypothetical protein